MELSLLLGGGMKSIQSGYVDALPVYGAINVEDGLYFDVTVAAVSTAKSVAMFSGQILLKSLGNGMNETSNPDLARYVSANIVFMITRARLINATTLRLSTRTVHAAGELNLAESRVIGRWTLLEAK